MHRSSPCFTVAALNPRLEAPGPMGHGSLDFFAAVSTGRHGFGFSEHARTYTEPDSIGGFPPGPSSRIRG